LSGYIRFTLHGDCAGGNVIVELNGQQLSQVSGCDIMLKSSHFIPIILNLIETIKIEISFIIYYSNKQLIKQSNRLNVSNELNCSVPMGYTRQVTIPLNSISISWIIRGEINNVSLIPTQVSDML
jgi:hypothetical protein